jgi:hypothetical protein
LADTPEDRNLTNPNTNDAPTQAALADQRKAILQEIVLDAGDSIDLLKRNVTRAKVFIQIDPHSGRGVLSSRGKALTLTTQIRLVLTAKRFAEELGLVSSPFLTYKQIADEMGSSPGSVSALLTDLVSSSLVSKNDSAGYAMSPSRIDATLTAAESVTVGDALPGAHTSVLGNGATAPRRRTARSKPEVSLKEMMASPKKDLSEYIWVKELTQKSDLGLAGLYLAREVYGRETMTCQQLSSMLLQLYSISATRAAINMAFNRARGEFVHLIPNGKDNAYKLLAPGEKYILGKRDAVLAKGTLSITKSST